MTELPSVVSKQLFNTVVEKTEGFLVTNAEK
jgi:hypothetical protein